MEDRTAVMEVYRQWWLHDARWYQGVAKRFGQDAANEINAEAMRYVAVHVGQRVARQRGGAGPVPVTELRERYDACSDRMFPPELRDGHTEVLGDGTVQLTMRRNFAVTMVRMAGSLAGYACPCTAIHDGWSEGLGVQLAENRAVGCLRHGDPACRLLMRPAASPPSAAAPTAPAPAVPAAGQPGSPPPPTAPAAARPGAAPPRAPLPTSPAGSVLPSAPSTAPAGSASDREV